jgi:hypothetical protein
MRNGRSLLVARQVVLNCLDFLEGGRGRWALGSEWAAHVLDEINQARREIAEVLQTGEERSSR